MSKRKQGEGHRGSLKWVQRLINEHPELIDPQLTRALGLKMAETIQWLSPLRPDYTEYRDADFLEVVGHPERIPDLRELWPRNGPQWDGLGPDRLMPFVHRLKGQGRQA